MTIKDTLLEIYKAGIEAVSPAKALKENIKLVDNFLWADGKKYDLSSGNIIVIGGGKGAGPMAQALENLLGSRIKAGQVVVKYDHAVPTSHIKIKEAAHPVPDQAGENAARECLELAKSCKKGDLLIVLLTGGASALLSLPAPGLTGPDIQQTTAALLASGADIGELNAIRKHLSAISGGRLAKAAREAQVLAIIVSDVIGDDLSVIASGPTAPDDTTFADCLAIIAKYDLENRIPGPVLDFLRAGAEETPDSNDKVFKQVLNIMAANNRMALTAAAARAESLGFVPEIINEHFSGEARDAARQLIVCAKKIADKLNPNDKPVCLVAGGETTVRIKGNGKGGRNQEMALAASLDLVQEKRIYALFAGTDGTDGPTDAAGGFSHWGIDSQQALESLEQNDSYNALSKFGDLFKSGPTLTNVMDMAILLIFPKDDIRED